MPIELGSSYLSADYSQKLMPLETFISNFILDTVGEETETDFNGGDIDNNLGCIRCNEDPCGASLELNNTNNTQQKMRNIGYLAQHRLFDQIPSLLKDIITPDYCALLTSEDEEPQSELPKGDGNTSSTSSAPDDIILNAWLGPSNTVSPLHHDPYHNLLAQVVGFKYVRLYHPSESKYLHPLEGRMNNNR